MNRQYYCKLGCWEELRDMLLELEDLGEPVQDNPSSYTVHGDGRVWCWLGFDKEMEEWRLLRDEPDDGTLVDSEELVMEVKNSSVEAWGVFLVDYGGHSKGTVSKITEYWKNGGGVRVEAPCHGSVGCNLSNREYKKFSTKEEAEKFSKELLGIEIPKFEKDKKYVIEEEETKPDKQTETKEDVKEEFKIGEWVATTNKDYTSYGKIRQVKNIDGDHIFIDSGGYWYIKYVRKATPEEIASVTKTEESYKVGDYVVITGNNNYSINRVGDIGVIKEVSLSDVYRVQVNGRDTSCNFTLISDMRKARPDEIPINDIMVGDYVIVESWHFTEVPLPQLGKVTRINCGNPNFEIQLTEDYNEIPGKWFFNRSEFRKALPHEIPGYPLQFSANPIELRWEEDIVKYLEELTCIKSLLDREEIEVTIKKTVPKQFSIF